MHRALHTNCHIYVCTLKDEKSDPTKCHSDYLALNVRREAQIISKLTPDKSHEPLQENSANDCLENNRSLYLQQNL